MVGSEKVEAPFTPEQVDSINGFQEASADLVLLYKESDRRETYLGSHFYTCNNCPSRAKLKAIEEGMVCDECGHVQGWVTAYMADGSWKDDLMDNPYYGVEKNPG